MLVGITKRAGVVMSCRIMLLLWSLQLGHKPVIATATDVQLIGSTGVLQHPNYPFDLRTDLHRIYNIYRRPSTQPEIICLHFFRFDLDQDANSNYLLFTTENVMFHGSGEVILYKNPSQNVSSVWQEHICFPFPNLKFRIDFNCQSSSPHRGFYAVYVIQQAPIPNDDNGCKSVKDPNSFFLDTGQNHLEPSNHSVCTKSCQWGYICDERGHSTCDCMQYSTAPCPRDQWTCFNLKCIPMDQLCDLRDDCGDASDEQYAHARCKGRTSYQPDACNFEIDTCGFLGLRGWIHTNRPSLNAENGPLTDHTVGKPDSGWYLKTDFDISDMNGTILQFQTQPYSFDELLCISFWYYMAGRGVGTLEVRLSSGLVWTKSGHQGETWHHGTVQIPGGTGVYIIFRATKGYSDSVIALDDIYIHPGICLSEEPSCSFLFGTCNWTTNSTGAFSWNQSSPNAKKSPSGGKYLVINASSETPSGNALLISPPIQIQLATVHCFRAWLTLKYTESEHTGLVIHVVYLNGFKLVHKVVFDSKNLEEEWFQFVVDIEQTFPFQVIVEATKEEGVALFSGLDDVSIMQGRCQEEEKKHEEPSMERNVSSPSIGVIGIVTIVVVSFVIVAVVMVIGTWIAKPRFLFKQTIRADQTRSCRADTQDSQSTVEEIPEEGANDGISLTRIELRDIPPSYSEALRDRQSRPQLPMDIWSISAQLPSYEQLMSENTQTASPDNGCLHPAADAVSTSATQQSVV